MRRRPSTIRRALALYLATQPAHWTGGVARAQTLEQQAADILRRDREQAPQLQPQAPSAQGPSLAGPRALGTTAAIRGVAGAPADPEAARAERPLAAPGSGAAAPLDEPLDPNRYVLGPGDVLDLHFWGIENFRTRVTVDLEGRAFVPKVGFFPVRGMTLAAVDGIFRESVARYFPKLSFGVTLVEPRTFLVQVVDDVVRPGPQAARAIDRVSAVISRAGGPGPNASRRRIEIRRRDGTVLHADLVLYALTGDVRHNPYVLDGDVVRVTFEKLAATIGGAVNRPGRYELVGSCDLEELVALAGGLAPTATRALPVMVVRKGPDERLVQSAFNFPPEAALPALAIEAEDSVLVPSLSDLQRSVTVVGAIAGASSADDPAASRRLPFAAGETVRTILEQIGGVGSLADLKRAYIVRGGQAHPVDLYALVMLRDSSADRTLELGDILVVPFTRRNILVEGAVFRPGSYQFNPTFGIEQYVALAGGLNRFAEGMEEVYVVTPDGQRIVYTPGLAIEPGSSLVAPERSFSRSEVVSIILAAAGIILSGTAIILTARK